MKLGKLAIAEIKLRLFTPEILDRLNREIVRAGHQALKKSRKKASSAVVIPLW